MTAICAVFPPPIKTATGGVAFLFFNNRQSRIAAATSMRLPLSDSSENRQNSDSKSPLNDMRGRAGGRVSSNRTSTGQERLPKPVTNSGMVFNSCEKSDSALFHTASHDIGKFSQHSSQFWEVPLPMSSRGYGLPMASQL